MPRIDAHQHFWHYDPWRDAWISEAMAVLRRDFLPADLAPLLAANLVDACVAVQADQCFLNIAKALQQAGASLKNVVRVHYILPVADDFPACWPVLRRHLGDVRPAATMFSAGLADPRMKIEIEVTARRGN